jgi:hypothetical protein
MSIAMDPRHCQPFPSSPKYALNDGIGVGRLDSEAVVDCRNHFLECDVFYSVEFYMRRFLPQIENEYQWNLHASVLQLHFWTPSIQLWRERVNADSRKRAGVEPDWYMLVLGVFPQALPKQYHSSVKERLLLITAMCWNVGKSLRW